VLNSTRYADTGVKPGTGRSGSAAIQTAAFVESGAAVLTVTSFPRNGSVSSPDGNIVKAQVKVYGANGRLFSTFNHTKLPGDQSTRVFNYTGIPAGASFVVQANVTGIDPRRTDVVTASATALTGHPDLAVTGITTLPRAIVRSPVQIFAHVRETSKDVGATGNCALYANDVQIDIARRIWVDAGGSVICAFATTFGSVGTYSLRAEIQDVRPSDAEPGNNDFSGTIEIVGADAVPPATFQLQMNLSDVTVTNYDSTQWRWTDLESDEVVLDQYYAQESAGREQSTYFKGTYYGPLSWPVQLSLRQSTGRVVLDSVLLRDVMPPSGDCFRLEKDTGVIVGLCYEASSGVTSLEYIRLTSQVTYRSSRYDYLYDAQQCDALRQTVLTEEPAEGDCYVVNRVTSTGALPTWGRDFSYAVRVTTGGVTYSAAPVVPLGAVDLTTVEPLEYASNTVPGVLTCPPQLPPEYCYYTLGQLRESWLYSSLSRKGVAATGAFLGTIVLERPQP
jgi:hypothetical protein